LNQRSDHHRKLQVHASSADFPGWDYSDEERRFLIAIERYQREQRRPYPTWREVLRVVHDLGYRQIEAPAALRS
jgi:hypothetical protein